MHQRHFWKQFPVPINQLRPWLLLSVALHAAVFSAPLLPSLPPTLPESEETVSLTPPPPSAAPLSPPAVPAAVTPSAVSVPTPQSPPRRVVPSQAPPLVVRPTPSRAAAPVVPSISPTPSPVAILSPSPALSPSPTPVVASPSPEATDPYATFPQIEGTTAGCGGRENCWQSADTQWRAIAHTLEQDLQNQGYSVNQVDLETETGIRVYRVSKAGESDYYLNLISTFEQGTVYMISEQPMTAAEIRQAAERRDEG